MTITNSVTASDGVTLAVHRYTEIDGQRPTILAIHGWPDNHHVWDGVAQHLSVCYNVVAYDVRGASESSSPGSRSGYRFDQLVSDIGAVIDSLGVGKVHLLGHDWGSIQGWAAVTDDSVMGKVASFTSISGRHLQYAGTFRRSARTPRTVAAVARQLVASGCIGFFLCPGVPEMAFRTGLGRKVVGAVERIGRSSTCSQRSSVRRSVGDYVNGLNLYRENMPAPLLSPGSQLPRTSVPTQVLVPRKDMFVTPALQRFTGAIPAGGRVITVEGGHWVVTSRPDVIARLTGEWIDRIACGATADAPVVRGGPPEVRGELELVTRAGRR
jgi:pimeloyl-ACP methyl ester carboxylesterase